MTPTMRAGQVVFGHRYGLDGRAPDLESKVGMDYRQTRLGNAEPASSRWTSRAISQGFRQATVTLSGSRRVKMSAASSTMSSTIWAAGLTS